MKCSPRAWRLILATASVSLTTLAAASPSQAASMDQMTMMEKQIKAMQAQLATMKREHQREMNRIHQQMALQRQAEETDPYGARNAYRGAPPHASASPNAGFATAAAPGPRSDQLLPPVNAATPYGQLTGTPTGRVLNLYGPLHRGQVQIGGVRITLGGYAEAATIFRSRNNVADISSNYGSIPFANNPNYHINEFHETARQSRLAALVEGDITKALRAQAYIETDFQGAGSASNSRQSNSYVLRERVFYGQLIDDVDDLTLLGGQNWSLLTMFNHGMRARDEQVPLTIEAQYVPGFNWTRNTQIRLVKGFDHSRYNIGLSVENPQQVISPGSGGQYLPPGAVSGTYQNAGANVNNPSTNYSTDIAPDIIAKVGADPGWGHYELTGLLRFAHSRVSYDGYGKSSTHVAGGGGGGLILPVNKKHKVYFQASGLVGTGIGRYGTSNIPDVTIDQKGQVKPMPAANVLVGLYGNPTKALQLYAYGGMEMLRARSYFNAGGKHYGYGNPLYNVSGCDVEGAASSSCQSSINRVVQGTAGFWWTYMHGDYGTLRVGAQYSFTYVSSFSGVGGTPHTNDNMVFLSLRYLPFQ